MYTQGAGHWWKKHRARAHKNMCPQLPSRAVLVIVGENFLMGGRGWGEYSNSTFEFHTTVVSFCISQTTFPMKNMAFVFSCRYYKEANNS